VTPRFRSVAPQASGTNRLRGLDFRLEEQRVRVAPYACEAVGVMGSPVMRAFPPDVLARLRRVKRDWDPHGVIRANRPVEE
jgi:hypothetical protein